MIKKQHIRLWRRPSKDGKSFVFYLRYVDLEGIQRCESLGHNDERKAEKQRIAKEKERVEARVEKGTMKVSTAVNKLETIGDVKTTFNKSSLRIVTKIRIMDETMIPLEYMVPNCRRSTVLARRRQRC